jgi:hypothetical protein
MKILHIFRSQPTEQVLGLVKNLSEEQESKRFPLYEDKIDYAQLVEEIFSHDKVISWW